MFQVRAHVSVPASKLSRNSTGPRQVEPGTKECPLIETDHHVTIGEALGILVDGLGPFVESANTTAATCRCERRFASRSTPSPT